MSVVVKKVTDADGNKFDVNFWQDGTAFYPMQKSNNVGEVSNLFFRFADLNGDGTGTYNLVQDYSTVADIAYVQPAAGKILRLERMIVFLRDTGIFDADGYGAAGVLSNGITVRIQNDSGTILDLTAQETVITNAGWVSNCFDGDVKTWGTGDNFLTARWTFAKAGQPIRLVGDNNERLEILLNDNFSVLVNHAFNIQGYWEVGP